jgi:glucose-6-phosphate 1-epimerase
MVVAGSVVVETGAGGLSRARLTAAGGEAEVYLQGAHVTHWQPRGAAPVLFLSARSAYAPG